MAKTVNIFLFITLSLLIVSCTSNSDKADITDIKSDIQINRFDYDLIAELNSSNSGGLNNLKSRYGNFFNYFTHQVMGIPEGADSVVVASLQSFIHEPEIVILKLKVDSVFTNMDSEKRELDEFLKHYQYYFPDKLVPGVVTYISAFNYAVIITDSVIGIGLDMFLGADSEYYPQLGIPKFMSSKFSREYIVPSAIKAWYQSDYEPGEVKKEFLSQMIYHGKMLYFIHSMAPEMQDSLKTGFSGEQLKWCGENESRIWSFFIEKKLLFSADMSEYAKFINDGPTSNGFPKEAPARIGAWVGWQIVKTYMNKNSDVTLEGLLKENDALKILEQSGYKPQR